MTLVALLGTFICLCALVGVARAIYLEFRYRGRHWLGFAVLWAVFAAVFAWMAGWFCMDAIHWMGGQP